MEMFFPCPGESILSSMLVSELVVESFRSTVKHFPRFLVGLARTMVTMGTIGTIGTRHPGVACSAHVHAGRQHRRSV